MLLKLVQDGDAGVQANHEQSQEYHCRADQECSHGEGLFFLERLVPGAIKR